jgi:hypothetical protein
VLAREWGDENVDQIDYWRRKSRRSAEVLVPDRVDAAYLRRAEAEVMDYVVDWKKDQDKPPAAEEVADAVRNLGVLGWLELTPTADLPVPDPLSELVSTP